MNLLHSSHSNLFLYLYRIQSNYGQNKILFHYVSSLSLAGVDRTISTSLLKLLLMQNESYILLNVFISYILSIIIINSLCQKLVHVVLKTIFDPSRTPFFVDERYSLSFTVPLTYRVASHSSATILQPSHLICFFWLLRNVGWC